MAKRISFYTVQLVKEKGTLYDSLKDGVIRSPEDGADLAYELMNIEGMTKEHFWIFTLDVKNKVKGIHIIHVGSLNASVVHPREVFQQAILNNAASIVVFHNHPSGDPTPSQEDIHVTRRLNEVGKMLGIELLDHLVMGFTPDGNKKFVSLKEKGYL